MRKVPGSVKWILIGLSVLALLVVVVLVPFHLWTSRRVEAALEQIRKKGAPVEFSQIVPPPVPEEENAASLYMEAFGLAPGEFQNSGKGSQVFSNEPFDFDWQSLAGKPPGEWSEEERTQASEVLQHYQPLLERVEEASERKECRLPLDFSKGFAMPLPHLSPWRKCEYLLVLKALWQARRGEREEASAAFRTALRLADHSRMEPSFVSQLVRSALATLALKGIEQVLSEDNGDPAAYKPLFEELEKLAAIEPFVRSLEGERVLGLSGWKEVMDKPEGLGNLVAAPKVPAFSYRLFKPLYLPFMRLDLLEYLRLMDRHIELAKQPYPAAKAEVELFDAQASGLPFYCVFSKFILPALASIRLSHEVLATRAGLCRIALALKVHRYRHGSYPDSLEALSPVLSAEQRTDPFTGTTYRYRRDGEGFVLYSLGANGLDDGAVDSSSDYKQGDIVWQAKR